MSGNTIGKLFVTSFGESHGLAIGCIVDGCPGTGDQRIRPAAGPGPPQAGQSRYTSAVRTMKSILSGVFEGRTTGAAIGMIIENKDQKSKDYSNIKDLFNPPDSTRNTVSGTTAAADTARPGNRHAVAAGGIAKKSLRNSWA